jgi:hypothetical protein
MIPITGKIYGHDCGAKMYKCENCLSKPGAANVLPLAVCLPRTTSYFVSDKQKNARLNLETGSCHELHTKSENKFFLMSKNIL